MIITMKKDATTSDIEHVMKQLKERGLQIHESIGENFNVFGVVGDTSQIDPKRIEANPHVESVVRVSSPYKKASRMFHPEDTIVEVNGIRIGGNEKLVVIGGGSPIWSLQCRRKRDDHASGPRSKGCRWLYVKRWRL